MRKDIVPIQMPVGTEKKKQMLYLIKLKWSNVAHQREQKTHAQEEGQQQQEQLELWETNPFNPLVILSNNVDLIKVVI